MARQTDDQNYPVPEVGDDDYPTTVSNAWDQIDDDIADLKDGTYETTFTVEDSNGTGLFTISGSGPVEVRNTNLDISDNSIIGQNGNLSISNTDTSLNQFGGGKIGFTGSSGSPALDDASNTTLFRLNDGGPVEISQSDLRLATGQSIEDGGGTNRFEIDSGSTKVVNDAGNNAIVAADGIKTGLTTYSGTPLEITDQAGGFAGVKYLPSSSAPGTFELTNSNIDMNNNNITMGDNSSSVVWDDLGGGTEPLVSIDGAGEVIARDDDGNTTTLT